MSLTLKPLIRDIILANYTVSAGLCRLNQAFAGLRQAATERKYGWPRDSIGHNSEGGIIRGARARYRQTVLNSGQKKKDPAGGKLGRKGGRVIAKRGPAYCRPKSYGKNRRS